jgi:hypothetical protein
LIRVLGDFGTTTIALPDEVKRMLGDDGGR